MSKVDYESSVKSLKQCRDIQCANGNWNYDPYMHGMANGLILALSMFEEGTDYVDFLSAPQVWLEDMEHSYIPTAASQYEESSNE